MGPNQKDPRGSGGSGSSIGGSRPLLIEKCFERYEAALKEVCQRSADVFCHLGISIDAKLSGEYAEREGDKKILEAIFTKLCAGKEDDPPLRILEVGAGPTLSIGDGSPGQSDALPPWTARALKRAFGELVDVTVTDAQPERYKYLVVITNRGEYVTHATIIPPIDFRSFNPYTDPFPEFGQDVLVRGDGSPVALEEIREMVKSEEGDRPPAFERLIAKHREVDSAADNSVKVHILQAITPAHEKIHYDILSIPGVDFRQLDQGKIEGGFDFVFGRHLFPVLGDVEQVKIDVNRSVQAVLRPGGSAIFSFDGMELTYEKEPVVPSGLAGSPTKPE